MKMELDFQADEHDLFTFFPSALLNAIGVLW
jgi:hypothetical protein